ncbi:MAG: glycine cleavage system protein GcvH [Syntrophomonadaceae bacterium]|nr:glycine cleavage system protein GcvH [Syntrophomonadaceae bacterium]
MYIPEELLYDKNNYWVKVMGEEVLIGLTEYGQSTTGDILYLELVPEDTVLPRGEQFGSIESGKWVGQLTAPVSGVVVERNRDIEASPRQVNAHPYEQGWLVRVKLIDPGELESLMGAADYTRWVEEQIRLDEEDEVAL